MLFTPENAQLILEGKKWQTRRLVQVGDYMVHYDGADAVRLWNKNYRLKWRVGRTYAVQPGRGKPGIGFIRITAIRQEQLQDISEGDALAEGMELCAACGNAGYVEWTAVGWAADPEGGHQPIAFPVPARDVCPACGGETAVEQYQRVWGAINRKPGTRWADNPAVWVLTFERVQDGSR